MDARDLPFDGDSAWRITRKLRDGTTIAIRPIAPEDRDELRREFERSSPETRYLRFLGVVGDLSDATLTYLTCVDQQNHIALVATVTSPDLKTERGVGVARVIRNASSPTVGEAAITVWPTLLFTEPIAQNWRSAVRERNTCLSASNYPFA